METFRAFDRSRSDRSRNFDKAIRCVDELRCALSRRLSHGRVAVLGPAGSLVKSNPFAETNSLSAAVFARFS